MTAIKKRKVCTRNRTGVTGVVYDDANKKWRAFITKDKQFRHLGRFKEFSEAVAARSKAEMEPVGQ